MPSDIQTNTYGVTLAGFMVKPFSQIEAELIQQAQAIWGATVDVGPDGPVGQMIGNEALKVYQLWEALQAVYSSFNPNSAAGISLDRVAAMIAVKRNPATATQAIVAEYGTAGTTINAGDVVSQSGQGNQFSLVAGVTIALTSLLACTLTIGTVSNGHPYTVTLNGNLVSYTAGVSDTAITIAAALVSALNALAQSVTITNPGTGAFSLVASDGSTPFSISGLDAYTSSSALASPGTYLCTQTGPIAAPAASVNTINTPVNGRTAVSNLAAGTIGSIAESDAAFRVRRTTALLGGDATDVAIAAYIQQNVSGVTFAYCVSNRTNSADGLGRPAHSFELQVIGGTNQAIANALWQCMPSGIQPYGNVGPLTVVDSSGYSQTVYFSRPVAQYIWIKATIGVDGSGTYPSNGGALIKSAIVTWLTANIPLIGGTVKNVSLNVPTLGIPGIESASFTMAVTSSTTPPAGGAYSGSDITLTTEQQAAFAVSQILVNGS